MKIFDKFIAILFTFRAREPLIIVSILFSYSAAGK